MVRAAVSSAFGATGWHLDHCSMLRRRLNGQQWLGVILVVSGLALTGLDASHFGPDAPRPRHRCRGGRPEVLVGSGMIAAGRGSTCSTRATVCILYVAPQSFRPSECEHHEQCGCKGFVETGGEGLGL